MEPLDQPVQPVVVPIPKLPKKRSLKVDRETRAFDEGFGYMGPGLEEIAQAAERAGALAAECLAGAEGRWERNLGWGAEP